jgi:hypothetical protein
VLLDRAELAEAELAAATGSVAGRGRLASFQLVAPETQPGIAVRAIAEGSVHRTVFAATRTADAQRPSVRALLAAVRAASANLGWA